MSLDDSNEAVAVPGPFQATSRVRMLMLTVPVKRSIGTQNVQMRFKVQIIVFLFQRDHPTGCCSTVTSFVT